MSLVPVLGRAVQAPMVSVPTSTPRRGGPCRAEADDDGDQHRHQDEDDQPHGSALRFSKFAKIAQLL